MRVKTSVYFFILFLALLMGHQGCGKQKSEEVVDAQPAGLSSPADFNVKSITRLANYAMRPQWSFDGTWILFDRVHTSSVTGSTKWQIWRVRADGSGEECLTCNRIGNPGNNGGPHMSPDGRYVVFSAEKNSHPALPPTCPSCSDPGAGLYNDIAVLDLQTLGITRLTNVSVNSLSPGGSMHPRFSFDGTKIMWSDFQGATSELGNYRIGVADFIPGALPSLANLTYIDPGPKPEMMESQGFSPDGSKIFFTCTALAGQQDLNADICQYDLSSQILSRITFTSGLGSELSAYEEHGAINPKFPVFAFMSSGYYGTQVSNLNFLSWLKNDIWISSSDGNSPRQVTFFNTPGYPESLPYRTIVSKMNWDPTGTKLIVSLWKIGIENDSSDDVIEIAIVSF